MNKALILTYLQIASAVLLVACIMIQRKGEGLSSGLGGGMSMDYGTKRGVEKWVFIMSIVCAVIFVSTSVARLVVG
jgi:protein translocase SecG subunit